MRAIPLLKMPFQPPGIQQATELVYADMMRIVLLSPRAGRGIATEEGMKAADIGAKIRGVASGASRVLLEEADWSFLCSKLMDFQWAAFDESVADFVRAVRDAAPIDPNAPE